MATRDQIEAFFAANGFGVVGASADRAKFGNQVLRCYLSHGKHVVPVNPKETSIEEISCVPRVDDLPPEVTSLSIITPPHITEQVVDAAIAHGIRNIWMQPGAESAAAIQRCQQAGINCIADGTCILDVLGRH